MKKGIERYPFARRSRPSIFDAIRMQAAISAFGLSLVGLIKPNTPYHFQIVFDRGSERPDFMKKAREFMCSQTLTALVIDDVQWLSRDEEPLIMVSDWIGGSVRRDMKTDNLPLTRHVLPLAVKAKGRLHDRKGFTAYLPKESTATQDS